MGAAAESSPSGAPAGGIVTGAPVTGAPVAGATTGGAPPPDPAPLGAEEIGRPVPPRRGYLVPGAIALVVLAIIAVVIDVAGLQSHTPHTLVGSEVATTISQLLGENQALESSQGLGSPPQVHCPASEPLRAGLVFDCTVSRSGRSPDTVRVTEQSSAGNFHIQLLPAH